MKFGGGLDVNVYVVPLLDGGEGGEGVELLFEGGTKDQEEGASLYRSRRDAGPLITNYDEQAIILRALPLWTKRFNFFQNKERRGESDVLELGKGLHSEQESMTYHRGRQRGAMNLTRSPSAIGIARLARRGGKDCIYYALSLRPTNLEASRRITYQVLARILQAWEHRIRWR